jgi:hypothetical protein
LGIFLPDLGPRSGGALAESVNDPAQRAEMLRFAKMWMSLSEPMPDLPSAYELPRRPLAKAA